MSCQYMSLQYITASSFLWVVGLLNFTTLHYIKPMHIALQCVTLHYSAFPCIALHYIPRVYGQRRPNAARKRCQRQFRFRKRAHIATHHWGSTLEIVDRCWPGTPALEHVCARHVCCSTPRQKHTPGQVRTGDLQRVRLTS